MPETEIEERRSVTTLIIYGFSLVNLAVPIAHRALFTHAAQVCLAASRIFVHSKIHEQFLAKSVELANKRVVGDPFDLKTEQGPQVWSKQLASHYSSTVSYM